MKKLLFFSILLTTAVLSFAQQKGRAQLSGKITDAKTGESLGGASIYLVEAKQGTTTDSSGRFLLRNIPSGHALLEISYEGYRSVTEHLDIAGVMEKNYALNAAVVENEGVTVTAVGSAISIRKAPIAITRVNREELLATPSTNIIDALRKQPGVSQLTTGPAVSKPVIRGLGYNRLVVINDGVRQEGQQWGDEHGIEIDENSVSRIEIVKGPASLIYGSDALAGVVNVVTTAPVPTNTIRGNILGSYGTNNRQRSFFGSLGGNSNGFNWNAWGDYTAAADYGNKYDGRVWNSKFNNKNVGGYLGYNGGWGYTHLILTRFNQHLGLVEGERNADGSFIKNLPGGVDGKPTQSDFNSTDPSVPYQHILHTKAILDNSMNLGSGRLSLNFAWQRNQRQEFGNADDPEEKDLYFDLHTFSYSTAYHFNDHNGWNTSVGLNGMVQNNKNKGLDVLIPEYSLFDLGGFVYTQKTAGNATLSGGLRYDHRHLDAKEFKEGAGVKFKAFQTDFSNVSASIGISYVASKSFLLKANAARGFRAPSIPELASNGAHEGTNRYEYGDQHLKSETSWQGDLGFELTTDHVLFTTSVFYNHINNFIFYGKLASRTGGDSLVPVGADLIPAFRFGQHTANLYGVEASLDLHPHPFDWLHWENTVSYVRGKFAEAVDNSGNLPFVPAAHFISQLRAQLLPKGKSVRNLSLFIEVDNTASQQKPFTGFDTETATPGYTLLNAGITATVTNGSKTLFSLYLLGNNVTDEAYQNHLSRLKYTDVNGATGRQGVYNAGRNFVFKVNVPLHFSTGKND